MKRWLLTMGVTLLMAGCAASTAPENTPETDTNTTMEEPPDMDLQGNRFRPLTWDEMTDAQKTMVAHILEGPRGGLGGPFNVLLRSPEMGDMAQELGAYARITSSLPGNLRELAIVMTARFWRSDFEWYAHKAAALREGVDAGVVDAIARGDRPEAMTDEETVVYNLVQELLYDRRASDATFNAAVEALGERGVVDVVGTVGYYGLVSLVLNVDEYPLPEGATPELEPLP